MRLLRPLLLTSLALLALTLGAVPPQAQVRLALYHVRDLGTLGGQRSWASGINDHGQVVGCAELEEEWEERRAVHAFLWSPQRGMRDLGTIRGSDSYAADLNNRGVVVGDADGTAFRWTSAGGMVALPTEAYTSSAYAINEKGMIVGWGDYSTGPKARLWIGDRDHRIDAHTHNGTAFDINEAGEVAGGGTGEREAYRAFRWRNGRTLLPLQGERRASGSVAYGINDRGEIVGETGSEKPFLWSRGTVTYLPTLPGAVDSSARRINRHGQVVGWSTDVPRDEELVTARAVLWQSGRAYDLNTLIAPDAGWELKEATDINSRGQIVGHGLHQGVRRAFLLTPR